MDPLTIPLALGCILTFSNIDKAMTETDGAEPGGIVYKMAMMSDAKGQVHILESAVHGQGISPGSYFRAGRSPDGLFLSYIVFSQGVNRISGDVRFASAETCAPIRFVRVHDGSTVDAASYRGWQKSSPHTVRVWGSSKPGDSGLPIDEARRLNPAIADRE